MLQPATDHGSTGAGAAGEGLAHTAFIHAQPDMRRIQNLHETDVDPMRKKILGLNFLR